MDKKTLAIIEVTKIEELEFASLMVHKNLKNRSKEEKVSLVYNILETLTAELDITPDDVICDVLHSKWEKLNG